VSRSALNDGDQGQVRERVRELRAEAGLQVRQQVELAAVVGSMAAPAERRHTIGVVAAAKRARNQVRRVDRPPTADEARLACHLRALRLRGGADPRAT
jgi:hypothetical protein